MTQPQCNDSLIGESTVCIAITLIKRCCSLDMMIVDYWSMDLSGTGTSMSVKG